MQPRLNALLVVATLACSSLALAQATAPTSPPRDLNKEAEAQKSSASGQFKSLPPSERAPKSKEKPTKEQQKAVMQEMQNRSTSSAAGAPVPVDKKAAKTNPTKAYKDMTPEERKQLQEAAKKASTP